MEELEHFVDDEPDYSSFGGGGGGRMGTTADGTDLADLGAPEQVLTSAEVVLPTNFLSVTQRVFQTFWDMDFPPDAQVCVCACVCTCVCVCVCVCAFH